MAGRPTSWAERAAIMLHLVRAGGQSKAEILDKTYVRAGMDPARDGTKVYLRPCFLLFTLWAPWLYDKMISPELFP